MAALDNEGDVVLGPGTSYGVDSILLRDESTLAIGSTFSTKWRSWADTSFRPLAGLQLSTNDAPRRSGPGTLAGADVPLVRLVPFSGWVQWDTDANFRAFCDAFYSATAPISTGEAELSFRLGGVVRTMFGRFRLGEVDDIELYGLKTARWSVRFEATDPWLYTPEVSVGSVPISWTVLSTDANNVPDNASFAGSMLSFAVSGEGPARWRVATAGSTWTNPVLWDSLDDTFLWFHDDTFNLNASTSTALSIDGAQRLASSVVDGDYNQYLSGYSSWMQAQPGSTHTLSWHPRVDAVGTSSTVGSGSGTVTLYRRWAYRGLGGS